MKIKQDISTNLQDAIDNYYHYNPDTLMPMLMLALALKRKLKIIAGDKKPAIAACALEPNEIKDYEWVKLNQSLKRKVNKWVKDGVKYVSVEMEIGRSLLEIYKTIKRNDEKDVVQEHHHRIGRLVLHSNHSECEKAERQYATFILAETLLTTSTEFLTKEYFRFFNHILDISGLQPKRPRMEVARVLNTLLKYDGKGLVYNPFAGCSIAGAMLRSKDNFYGDGDSNDKLYAAGLLLNYGMGVSNEHFLQRDSTQWLTNKKIDYVISTYTGYIKGKTAFEFCLDKCLVDENFTGKYAGMVQPKEVFEKEMPAFKEALERDWIETIILMPFGEVAILVNANKAADNKKKICLINSTTPLTQKMKIEDLVDNDIFTEIITTYDAKKKGYLKSQIIGNVKNRNGYKKVRLRELVKKIPKKVYNLEKYENEKRVLAYIDHSETFYRYDWDENIKRKTISKLFSPAYLLDNDSLIVNQTGPTEPRLFNANKGSAFFDDGLAFSLNGSVNPDWLANELEETYVQKQLHPYGINAMVPEELTEEDFLNIIIYIEVEDVIADNEIKEDGTDALEIGYTLIDDSKRYTILNFIARGEFGYTYRAEMLNIRTGEKEIVAIKELYPRKICYRINNMVIVDDEDMDTYISYQELFRSEPDFILSMSDVKDNHVTEVKSIFEYEPTGTMYYVMKYYAGASLHDMIIASQVPTSEPLIIEKIVIPLCKALNAMHSHNILHLDIKPDNIVIDENGEAVLIDFGVAQLYDTDGRLLSLRETHSTSPFSAPENKDGLMHYFCPQTDIYGAAATLFTMMSNKNPRPIKNNDIKWAFVSMNCSDKMKRAIAEGLCLFTNDRPTNAQMFLNNFPGCENIKL